MIKRKENHNGLFYSIVGVGLVILVIGFLVWRSVSDPLGEDNKNCIRTSLSKVSNGAGLIVSSYNTVCDTMGGNSAIYVHVRKELEAESRDTLVFRYFDIVDVPAAKTIWIDKSHLRIEVGEVSKITKKIESTNGVGISYSIGSERYR